MYLLAMIALIFYITKFPERLFPGKHLLIYFTILTFFLWLSEVVGMEVNLTEKFLSSFDAASWCARKQNATALYMCVTLFNLVY